jgi:hypothetical protein
LIDAFKTAPMDEFMAKAAAEEMDIQGTREFWRKAITHRINALEQFPWFTEGECRRATRP